MELHTYARCCAEAYNDIGQINGWRKGRNSSRGYDLLTVPSDAWDDRPYERYLLLVHSHLSSAAAQLGNCGDCYGAGNTCVAVTSARAVFVESSRASWLLEDGVMWTRRAARAHLELLGNLETQVRRLPKRLDSGYPNFARKQWQAYRKQLRDEVIVDLFGKRALSRNDDEPELIGEALLTSSHLEEQFAALLGVDAPAGGYTAGPDVLLDPSARVEVHFETPFGVDNAVAARSLGVAFVAWLDALDAWVRYNAWDTGRVDALKHARHGLEATDARVG